LIKTYAVLKLHVKNILNRTRSGKKKQYRVNKQRESVICEKRHLEKKEFLKDPTLHRAKAFLLEEVKCNEVNG
jgi:predicted MarR family transcription regulator